MAGWLAGVGGYMKETANRPQETITSRPFGLTAIPDPSLICIDCVLP